MCGFVFALLPLLWIGPREAQAGDKPPTNIVYVESNDPNGNAIFAFKRADDGSLTPLPGSPFSAKGLGITPTFALGSVRLGPGSHRQSVATRCCSPSTAAPTRSPFSRSTVTARSRMCKGSPFPSGGSNPVSVGLADDILCVVNQDNDPGHPGQFLPNYTSFSVGSEGSLTPIPRSTVSVDAGSSPVASPDRRPTTN